MSMLSRIWAAVRNKPFASAPNTAGNQSGQQNSDKGHIADPERSVQYLYDMMQCDPNLRAAIVTLRHMDKIDPRVKKIHRRIARDATKGGLKLHWVGKESQRVNKLWLQFVTRLQLTNRAKLMSDAGGLAKEGNLPLQWVVNEAMQVTNAIRMPTETIIPIVDQTGRFRNPKKAFRQIDPITWQELCTFPLWQLTVSRLDPDNFDDMGCMGRPYLDANRTIWQKLIMTEEDLVIRRRTRAPQKLAHSLDGADKAALDEYRERVEVESGDIATDFYGNKLSVTAVSGDANMDQIADISLLIDAFFSGAPAPKGLFGYVDGMARDILEDLKRDYYEEIDALQDALAYAYQDGFKLQLLLAGLNPDSFNFQVQFAERMTDTKNQRADLALKYQALGMPRKLAWEAAGVDVQRAESMREEEANSRDPYPDPYLPNTAQPSQNKPNVSITPGNQPKGESATAISNG
ncbi:hypothetical protein [Photobacterium sp. OFAV2-7]|uniref:hypothetical protein n=1 Tax=Photobacterium sp. OFAV2-7 TaxID=2917748 RepID=UPI001EF752C3|nr:hypothetical protein [Photobacterium sp. OFAV2-7]MCG7588129.1 hypothetical protein [Photobacterium sp. OFAV2-7]